MDNARYKPDGRKRYTTWLWCGILYLVTWYCSADEINLYSINTGSYVYHLTHNHGQYTENFKITSYPWSENSLMIQNIVLCSAQ